MPIIIVDRKHKKANSDNQWKDPLGIEEAKREKARTIEVPNDSDNPIYKFLRQWPLKCLLGKKVFCLTDRKMMISGHIKDVIPPDYLLLKNDGGMARFKDVVSIGD